LSEQTGSTSSTEDVAFALRVRQGDHDAFQALYERYGGAVLGLAQSVVRDRAVAEDITHDVFLGFWRNPNAFEPSRGQFVAWLLRVARNRAIDVLRKRREVPFGNARATQDGESVDPTQWLADPEPGPESQAMVGTLADGVRNALMTLPADHRHLLELAYFGGLTQREIAVRLNRPLGTVKTQMRSSLIKLSRLETVQSLITSVDHDQLVEGERGNPGSWSLTSANAADVAGPETS
jgi:RNA polymerase sigma-70 factor, ECF subfamily